MEPEEYEKLSESTHLRAAKKAFVSFLSKTRFEKLAPGRKGTVLLCVEHDGSFFMWNDAFVLTHEDKNGEWVCVVPEHYSLFVIHRNEISLLRTFQNKGLTVVDIDKRGKNAG